VRGLLEGYARYAEATSDPWQLTIIGDGPLADLVRGAHGVEWLGALPPPDVHRTMAQSGCLVLPSVYEPWGVVVHEAACAGLSLVLSEEVGAGAELLWDGYNGRRVAPRRPESIANAMRWISEHPEPWLLGSRSFEASHRLSPELWADNLVTRSTELLTARRS